MEPETLIPIERLPDEPDRAWAAFLDYCRMGPGRSLRKLVGAYREQSETARRAQAGGGPGAAELPPTRRLTTVEGWSDRYSWQARVAEFDAQQQADDLARWAVRREKARDRDWAQGDGLREIADKLIGAAPAVIDRMVKAGQLDLRFLTQVVETASKLQRLAAGLPDSHQEISGAGARVITASDLAEIRAELSRWENEQFGDGDGGGSGT